MVCICGLQHRAGRMARRICGNSFAVNLFSLKGGVTVFFSVPAAEVAKSCPIYYNIEKTETADRRGIRMAALVCEICGGKLLGQPGGIFECTQCGMEYSTAWIRAKLGAAPEPKAAPRIEMRPVITTG